MIDIYHNISEHGSKLITNAYSTSFSLGIKAFHKKYRQPIYNIYGFVRIADEIVDSFHGYNKKKLLQDFREDTLEAINSGISTNPVLNAFQKTVREYNIDFELIDAFLKSMEMDLYLSSHESESYDEYIFGSAEVVGLMCLKVFVQGDKETYEKLKPYAQALGSAFQKVNFLRDIKDDLEDKGRIYLPNIHREDEVNEFNKHKFEKDIDKEFKKALKGILKLPIGTRLGVYLAFIYYRTLFKKLKGKSINEIKASRIRISNFKKITLLIYSYFRIRIFRIAEVND
ncbi:MAG: phytoene/squalene synthase family protein [Ignavibacteria bacterium]|nr:MAG: phytoene/squalene synthase family protein [Ignavibacteria bacterium]